MAQEPEFDGPKSYAELFEKTANDPAEWLRSAVALAAAGRAVKEDDDNSGGGKLFADSGRMTGKRGVYVMLLGYSIECALKGMLVKRGNKLGTTAGTLERKFKSHKLGEIATAAQIPVNDEERETLWWLSCYIEYMGRYPIPTKWEKWMEEPAIGFALVVQESGNLSTVWSDAEHLSRAEALVSRLLKELEAP